MVDIVSLKVTAANCQVVCGCCICIGGSLPVISAELAHIDSIAIEVPFVVPLCPHPISGYCICVEGCAACSVRLPVQADGLYVH